MNYQYKTASKNTIIMITALLIWLFKKYGRPFLNKHNVRVAFAPVKRLSITIIFLAIGTLTFAQDLTLNYNVMHGDITVGHMKLQKTMNGKQKANKITKACNGCYQLTDDDQVKSIDQQQINNNLTLMYLQEPAGLSQVYSDNFQQFVQVKQVSSHTYRIYLPDGNYNFYTYTNGICS